MENKLLGKVTRMISLPHLFWYFLQKIVTRWYLFLIVMVVGTIAGAKYADMKNDAMIKEEAAKEPTTSIVEKYITVDEEEFASILNAAKLYDAISEQREYNENSIYLKAEDNLSFYQASAVYQVNTGDQYIDHQIATMYRALFDGSEVYQRIAEETGEAVEGKYIKEVFEIADLGGGMFRVRATAPSLESAKKMLESAQAYMKEKKSEMTKAIGTKYSLDLLSEESSDYITDLKGRKQNAQAALDGCQTNYDNAVAALSENARDYFYLYLNARFDENYVDRQELYLKKEVTVYPETEENEDTAGVTTEEEETEESIEDLAKKRKTIDTTLGFILGICCVCGFFIVRYCTSPVLVNGEDFVNMYKMSVFGYLIEDKKRKKISFWFLKRQKKNYNLKENAVICNEVVERLKLQFSGEDRICLVSTCNGIDVYKELLEEEGKKQGLCFIKNDNILEDFSALKELKDADYVLLIEKEGKTKYQDIDKEIQLSYEAGKGIVGAIVII